MTCTFVKRKAAVEVFTLSIEHNEFTDFYTLKVIGLDRDGNYTNLGHIKLSEQEIAELISAQHIDTPKQLVGRKIAVVSNALCKEAGISHLDTVINKNEWSLLQPLILKHNDPIVNADEGEIIELND